MGDLFYPYLLKYPPPLPPIHTAASSAMNMAFNGGGASVNMFNKYKSWFGSLPASWVHKRRERG